MARQSFTSTLFSDRSRILLAAVFASLTFSLYAQHSMMLQNKDGVKTLNLKSGTNTISTVPIIYNSGTDFRQ